MNIEFQNALDKKRILNFPQGKKLVKKEIKQAEDDLDEANNRYNSHKYKYATVTAYYSMFHSSRALIYSKGFREKSHYYLIVALKELFSDKGLLDEFLIAEYHDSMVLREEADYHGEFSKEGAEIVLKSAREFLDKARDILIV